MKQNILVIAICLVFFSLFFGCIQPSVQEPETPLETIPAPPGELATKLDIDLNPSTSQLDGSSISLSRDKVKIDLSPDKTYQNLTKGFEDISVSIKGDAPYTFEGGLENIDNIYESGYVLDGINVINRFERKTDTVISLDKIRAQDKIKHTVTLKNPTNQEKELTVDLEYNIPNVEKIIWNKQILETNKQIEFNAIEDNEIEAVLFDKSKSIIDFSDISKENHKGFITYSDGSVLILVQITVSVPANSEYIIDPYLSYVPYQEIRNNYEISEFNYIEINDDYLVMAKDKEIKIFENYIQSFDPNNPSKTITFSGELINILSINLKDSNLLIGTFPQGVYVFNLENFTNLYISQEQSDINLFGSNFYRIVEENNLYFITVPTFNQKALVTAVTPDLNQHSYLYADLAGSQIPSISVSCNENNICCFGVLYENAIYCIDTNDLGDNNYITYKDAAFLTFEGENLGKEILIDNNILFVSMMEKVYSIDISNLYGINNINDFPNTYGPKGYGKHIEKYQDNILISSNNAIHLVNKQDIEDISNNPKYTFEEEISHLGIAPNGNGYAVYGEEIYLWDTELPDPLYSMMGPAGEISTCGLFTLSGEYQLLNDLTVVDSTCLDFSGGLSSVFNLNCDGNTIYVYGDNLAAVKVNTANTFTIQNCNFVVEGSNSNALDFLDINSVNIVNCNFSIREGSNSNAIKNIGPSLSSGNLNANLLNINLNSLSNANAINLSNTQNIILEDINISLNNCFGTSGIGINNPLNTNILNLNIDSIGTNEQIAGVSIIGGNPILINNSNINIGGSAITGFSFVNSNNVEINNSIINIEGVSLTGIKLQDSTNIIIENSNSIVSWNDSFILHPSDSTSNNFVISALPISDFSVLKYDWIYSLFSKNTNLIRAQNNIFDTICFERIEGVGSGALVSWEMYNTMSVKLKDTYNINISNNDIYSKYCVALGFEDSHGSIENNKIIRSLDNSLSYNYIEFIPNSKILSAVTLLNMYLDSEAHILENNITSSLIGVSIGEGMGRYSFFNFSNNKITNCYPYGLISNIYGTLYDPNVIFDSNYICDNDIDIYGINKSVLSNFETTTCVNYNFIADGGSGNCNYLCYDCPEILNFNLSANCPDYENPNFAGEQEIPGDETQTIPLIYLNDSLCLNSNIINPSNLNLHGQITCYDLGLTPENLFENYYEASMAGISQIHLDGFYWIILNPEESGSIDTTIPIIDVCHYYQCFVHQDPQYPIPGCENTEETLSFFVGNRPPIISTEPIITEISTGLNCNANPSLSSFEDPDSDLAGSLINYTWYVNEIEQIGFNDNNLPNSKYSPGDTVICEVSIPDNSPCGSLYSNSLNATFLLPGQGWVNVNPHPEGYTDTIYYCDFEYQMPESTRYQIDITWYAFDYWDGDWSSSISNEPFIIDEKSFLSEILYYVENEETILDYQLEKCHYVVCEVNITVLGGDYEGYSLIGNSTMGATENPVSGQGNPTEIINRNPIVSGEVNIDATITSELFLVCDDSLIVFEDLDHNDFESTRSFTWYQDGSLLSYTNNMITIPDFPIDGAVYKCCVELFDSIVNEGCQDSDIICGEIEIPPRSGSFEVILTTDPLDDLSPSPEECGPIFYGDEKLDNCAYEDSDFACVIQNIEYSETGELTTKDVLIYDDEGNIFVNETRIPYEEIVYYNDCLENPNCIKGKNLYCNTTLYDNFGVIDTVQSNSVQIHNFIPEISKPQVLVISDAVPIDVINMGDYDGSMLESYTGQFVCIPTDVWGDDDRTPDYNNDNWDKIKYYWEWSPVDTGYLNELCENNEFWEKCSNNECFSNEIKNELCILKRRDCEEDDILCWGPEEDNEAHWLPFMPMAQLREYEAFSFIPNMNVTYGVCDWASLGGLTGCVQSEFTECWDGIFYANEDDDGSICRYNLYQEEMNLLKQCAQGTRQCYELLESCSFINEYTDTGIINPTFVCPSSGLVTIAGLGLTPEYVDWSNPWISPDSDTTWDYGCGVYAGTYRFWHTSWYLRNPHISHFSPYIEEANPCESNDYFGIKTNPELPSFSIWNTYLSDIYGLFYQKDKPHGIPIRCCIQQSDEGFESTYSNLACSDPVCGNYLDCGNCYYSEEGLICNSNINCISNSDSHCYIYLEDSCDNTILWTEAVGACAGVDSTTECYYNYTNGTAFDINRRINLITGEIIIEQTSDIQLCYPCMQYWPMQGDYDFDSNNFNEVWGYYYNPWWIRDLLWNSSYIPKTEGYLGELPEPDKVSLFESGKTFETVTTLNSDIIQIPCNPNTDEECEISLHEWWAGSYGAQQNDTFIIQALEEKEIWANNYGTLSKNQLSSRFGVPEENIVGRFFATGFKYCNQWDEEYIKDIIDYETERDIIDLYYLNNWPNTELSLLNSFNNAELWTGKFGGSTYITSGHFIPENSLSGLVWNADWSDEYDQYGELICDDYEQCRKHARISADYVFGIVYNTTYKRVVCECPSELNTAFCEAEYGPAETYCRNENKQWAFNKNTCSCQCVCKPSNTLPKPDCDAIADADPEIDRLVLHFDNSNCEWKCVLPRSVRPIVPTGSGAGYGTGIHWAEEEEIFIIEKESSFALFSDENYMYARFDAMADPFELPECNLNSLQEYENNCFMSDDYFDALYRYTLSKNISDLIVNSIERTISLDCSDLLEGYRINPNYCISNTHWDLNNCIAYEEERIGYILDTHYLEETENEGCGFCQGLLINNTAPEITELNIISNDAQTEFNCSIEEFIDIDNHPADGIKNATFRWCSDSLCTTEYFVETKEGPNPYSFYTNPSLPTDASGNPIIFVCAQIYDTGWQSKASEEYCTAYGASEPKSCSLNFPDVLNSSIYTYNVPPHSFIDIRIEEVGVEPELGQIANLYLINSSGDLIDEAVCRWRYFETGWTFTCIPTLSGIIHGTLDISSLPSGIYTLIANESNKGCTATEVEFRVNTDSILCNLQFDHLYDGQSITSGNDINISVSMNYPFGVILPLDAGDKIADIYLINSSDEIVRQGQCIFDGINYVCDPVDRIFNTTGLPAGTYRLIANNSDIGCSDTEIDISLVYTLACELDFPFISDGDSYEIGSLLNIMSVDGIPGGVTERRIADVYLLDSDRNIINQTMCFIRSSEYSIECNPYEVFDTSSLSPGTYTILANNSEAGCTDKEITITLFTSSPCSLNFNHLLDTNTFALGDIINITVNTTASPLSNGDKIADIYLQNSTINEYLGACTYVAERVICSLPTLDTSIRSPGTYTLIANNSAAGCTDKEVSINLMGHGIPITTCQILNTPNEYYYLANDIEVIATTPDYISSCPSILTTTDPHLHYFDYYPKCTQCCLLINASNITLNLNGYELKSNLEFRELSRMGGICGKYLENISIYNSNPSMGGILQWDRGLTLLASENIDVSNTRIDSLARSGASRANAYYTSGISLSGCRNFSLENSRIARYSSGIEAFYSKELNIENNIFATNSYCINSQWRGDSAGPREEYRLDMYLGALFPESTLADVNIENNEFLDCGTGITAEGFAYSNISNNIFEDNRYIGVEVRGKAAILNITNNDFSNIDHSAIKLNYINSFSPSILILNNSIYSSEYGILINNARYLYVLGVGYNTIVNGNIGIEFSNVNEFSEIIILENIIEDNEKGIVLNELEVRRSGENYFVLPIPNVTDWPEGSAVIEICDSNTLIGCYSHNIKVKNCDFIQADIWTNKECYAQRENIIIDIPWVCRLTDGLPVSDYATMEVSYNIYNSLGTVVDSGTHLYEYLDTRELNLFGLAITDQYKIDAFFRCYYPTDSSRNHNSTAVNQTFRVSADCPEEYYHFNRGLYHYSDGACFDEITDSRIRYHEVMYYVNDIPPPTPFESILTFRDSNNNIIHTDGTNICLNVNNVNISNNSICRNTIFDIKDEFNYCSDLSDPKTKYSNITCDVATSLSFDDDLICEEKCECCGLSFSKSCFDGSTISDAIRITSTPDCRMPLLITADVYLINTTDNTILDFQTWNNTTAGFSFEDEYPNGRNYSIVINNSICSDFERSIRLANNCKSTPDCSCDVEIKNVTWPGKNLPEPVCRKENVTIELDLDYSGSCPSLDTDDILIEIISPNGTVINRGYVNLSGYYIYTVDFEGEEYFGEYTIKATHDYEECRIDTDSFIFGECRGEETCQLISEICDATNPCCSPTQMENIIGYPFNAICRGVCCVPEGSRCYPEYTNITGVTQCCPELSCIEGRCVKIEEIEKPEPKCGDGILSEGEECEYNHHCGFDEICVNCECVPKLQTWEKNCSYTECNMTSDCCAGYCYQGVCMTAPATKWLFGFLPKQGCEGLPIQPIGILGFIICDLMWLWVLITASIAAYKSRQSYNMPIPIIVFVVPFIAALFLYPYIGVVIGIFEILIFFRKREEEVYEQEEEKAYTGKGLSDYSNFERREEY